MTPKPIMVMSGRNANAAPMPSHLMKRPVRNSCASSVSALTAISIAPNTRVRAALSSPNTRATTSTCWKYRNVDEIV